MIGVEFFKLLREGLFYMRRDMRGLQDSLVSGLRRIIVSGCLINTCYRRRRVFRQNSPPSVGSVRSFV
jgi:hypothetical protein